MALIIEDRLSDAVLLAHVEKVAGGKVKSIEKLDWNVYRVDRVDHNSLVARVYAQQHEATVKVLAELLEHLHAKSFPAEKLSEPAVAAVEGSEACTLFTQFVQGSHPERNRVTYFRIGRLLGKLHSLDVVDRLPTGGAWHHLSMAGGIREECDAAVSLLRKLKAQGTSAESDSQNDNNHIDQLIEHLGVLRDVFSRADLPHCIVHPDLVPVNIIEEPLAAGSASPHPKWTLVDWTGAGVGCRVLPLGFVLGAAAAKGKLVLVNAVMKAYAESVALTAAELEVLPYAVYARFFTLDCWSVAMGREQAKAVVEGLPRFRKLGEDVANRVMELQPMAA